MAVGGRRDELTNAARPRCADCEEATSTLLRFRALRDRALNARAIRLVVIGAGIASTLALLGCASLIPRALASPTLTDGRNQVGLFGLGGFRYARTLAPVDSVTDPAASCGNPLEVIRGGGVGTSAGTVRAVRCGTPIGHRIEDSASVFACFVRRQLRNTKPAPLGVGSIRDARGVGACHRPARASLPRIGAPQVTGLGNSRHLRLPTHRRRLDHRLQRRVG